MTLFKNTEISQRGFTFLMKSGGISGEERIHVPSAGAARLLTHSTSTACLIAMATELRFYGKLNIEQRAARGGSHTALQAAHGPTAMGPTHRWQQGSERPQRGDRVGETHFGAAGTLLLTRPRCAF